MNEQTEQTQTNPLVEPPHKKRGVVIIAGFFDFIREQGVVGLAIGFILGGAVSKTVSSLVENIINPLIGILMGKVNLADRLFMVGSAQIKYGAFISSIIDFVIVAAVVYFGFKILRIDQFDRKKK
jgi:large conductance mechanosensitive channel